MLINTPRRAEYLSKLINYTDLVNDPTGIMSVKLLGRLSQYRLTVPANNFTGYA